MKRRYHRIDRQDSNGMHNNSKMRQKELKKTDVSFRGLRQFRLNDDDDNNDDVLQSTRPQAKSSPTQFDRTR